MHHLARYKPALSLFVLLLGVLLPAVAEADLVRFSNGRLLSVKDYREEGETVVLKLRDGGELRMQKALVAEVLPDEAPWPEPVVDQPRAVALVAEPAASDLRGLIDRLAAQHGVDPRLAHAMIQVESNYEPRAVSSKGAKGLMQIMPLIARHYEVDDPFDPEENVGAGLRHLRTLLDRYGERTDRVSMALAAYNAGEPAVERYRGIPPYRETQNYVKRIVQLASRQ